MNVVCFMGGAADRQLIVDYELFHRDGGAPGTGRLGRKTRTPKFNVMLTSFEILRDCGNVFNQFMWDVAIVDEAHRLKSLQSATRCAPQRARCCASIQRTHLCTCLSARRNVFAILCRIILPVFSLAKIYRVRAG